jgi:hypothetical protein
VELYVSREGLWYRYGRHLPAFGLLPTAEGQALDRVIIPAPAQPQFRQDPELRPVALKLVREDRQRDTTAALCALTDLAKWADTATTAQLSAVRAARSGGRVLLRGRPLPALPNGERLWGERLLAPLGFRTEPALAEGALPEALGVGADEILLLNAAGAEVVPEDAFRPLTRAGVRLALREGT